MALYHTHRPQSWDTVIGQDHIVQTLSNQIAKNNPAHAYLFFGPRGVGKTTSARILAKALNCTERKDGSSEPCNTCSTCEEIRDGRAIDVIEIDAASHTGVDNVRENVIENAQWKPTKSKYKIFIIDEVHMLSTSAFNALLKTLEEPPSHVIFILATTELNKLPETIVSRCQRYTFSRVSQDTMKEHLKSIAKAQSITVEDEVLQRIAVKSEGCVRDGISLLDQLMATGEKKITMETASIVLPPVAQEQTIAFVRSLLDKDAQSGLSLLNDLYQNNTHVVDFADEVLSVLRTVMVAKISSTKDIDPGLASLVQMNVSEKNIVYLIDRALVRRNMIKTSPLPHLPLELLCIEYASYSGNANEGSTEEKKMGKQEIVMTEKQLGNREIGNNGIKETTFVPSSGRGKKHVEKTIVEPAEESVVSAPVREAKQHTSDGSITYDDIKKYWQSFLKRVERESPSLVFILKNSRLTGAGNGVVHVAVENNFHQKKLSEANCQKRVSDLMSEIVGVSVIVQAELNTAPKENSTPDLASLASALGGEVVV